MTVARRLSSHLVVAACAAGLVLTGHHYTLRLNSVSGIILGLIPCALLGASSCASVADATSPLGVHAAATSSFFWQSAPRRYSYSARSSRHGLLHGMHAIVFGRLFRDLFAPLHGRRPGVLLPFVKLGGPNRGGSLRDYCWRLLQSFAASAALHLRCGGRSPRSSVKANGRSAPCSQPHALL